MYDREVKERIKKINNTFRVLVVTGPRQVGKTTLLFDLMKNVTESLAGRARIVKMNSFTYNEIVQIKRWNCLIHKN